MNQIDSQFREYSALPYNYATYPATEEQELRQVIKPPRGRCIHPLENEATEEWNTTTHLERLN
jgi:hypothetical protein